MTASNSERDPDVTLSPSVMSRVRITLSHDPMSLLRVARRVAHRRLARAFASETSFAAPTASAYRVFDRTAKRTQKDRAASRDGGERSRTVDYVRDEVADRLTERLLVMCLCSLRCKRTG